MTDVLSTKEIIYLATFGIPKRMKKKCSLISIAAQWQIETESHGFWNLVKISKVE